MICFWLRFGGCGYRFGWIFDFVVVGERWYCVYIVVYWLVFLSMSWGLVRLGIVRLVVWVWIDCWCSVCISVNIGCVCGVFVLML